MNDILNRIAILSRSNRLALVHGEAHALLIEAAAEIERLRTAVEAAKRIHHGYDTGNGGMIVSGEHMRILWKALDYLDAGETGLNITHDAVAYAGVANAVKERVKS